MDIIGLLKFIETYCFDEQLYIVLPLRNGSKEEVIWRRSEVSTGRPWSVRSSHEGANWWRFTAERLPGALERRSVSMEAFEQELVSTAMIHVTHASLLIRDARDLLGDAAVESSVARFEDFSRELSFAIRDSLDLPDEGEHVERLPRGHLRLLVRDT
ncbi:MAG: hypothetical protein ACI8S6_004359 [Myxococcota bacterium]